MQLLAEVITVSTRLKNRELQSRLRIHVEAFMYLCNFFLFSLWMQGRRQAFPHYDTKI